MKRIKKLLDLVPLMILWLMLSIFFWGGVFTSLTNAAPENKLALFIDAPVPGATELAVRLEENITGDVRMVKVHPFTYAMMDDTELRQADMYIVSASTAESYRDWFCPLPENISSSQPLMLMDGEAYGVRVYEASAGQGAANEYITYGEEDYYLCFGRESLHVITNEGAVDDQAVACALHLLSIQ